VTSVVLSRPAPERISSGTGEWDGVLRVTLLLGLAAIPVVLWVPGAAGLTLFALLTLWVNGPLSPLLPATYEPVLIYFSLFYLPFTLAVMGTIASLYIEYVNYRLHHRLLRTGPGERLAEGRLTRKVVALFARSPALTVWLCAWSPLPYWPVRILSPLAGLPLRTHLLATAFGRFPRLWFVAAAGAQLGLDPATLVGLTLISVLVAMAAWGWSRTTTARRPI
jgi:membrane protein YqaA with SNARE-associated domain